MMYSLSKYLGAKKTKAHADSIPALNSIAEQLETVITEPDLEKDTIEEILSSELLKYRSLKNKIASRPSITDEDINGLKAVILSIDWEISDATLQSFETVTATLLQQLKNYKIHYTYLKIIPSTGRHIGRQKANAPTDSLSFLRSVFENFERIVQTADMSFKEKKQILETDINRFYDYKQKIARKKAKPPLTEAPLEDEYMPPALSHIKQTGAAETEAATLTTLSESDGSPAPYKSGSDTSAPAPAGRKKLSAGPKDIMDDLFSGKESPADELLDAIHLQDVPGQSQVQALNMLNQTKNVPADGVKNFTLQRKDNEPIPEIGNRLDEFFNLDAPGDGPVLEDIVESPPTGIKTAEDDSPAEEIVPFQPDDESFTDSRTDEGKSDTELDILIRLKTTLQNVKALKEESSRVSINSDIDQLEKTWENDPEKACLIQIIALLANQMGIRPDDVLLKHKKDTDIASEEANGILGKIKGIFTS